MMYGKRKLVTLPALLLGASSLAQADTFSVTTTDDLVDDNVGDGVCLTVDNNCSLRAAIQETNAWPGADVIELPAGLYNLTINDEPPPDYPERALVPDNMAVTGDLDIRDDLVINGVSSASVAVDGSSMVRVFDITQNANVTINGITIRNGANNSNNGTGGGINIGNDGVDRAVVTINNSNIELNSAAYGGGINVTFGNTLVLNRSVVRKNTSLSHAGGINNDSGTVTINQSSIINNEAVGFGNPFGGGIFNSSANGGGMTIRDSLIAKNRAAFYGGGIYHIVGKLWIYNTTISGNRSFGWGGGIYHTGGTFSTTTLQHVTMTGNRSEGITNQQTSPRGGAIYNSNGARILMTNSIISGNGSNGENCYIEHSSDSRITKIGNVITDNSCLNQGETGAQVSLSPGLNSQLADSGGPTQTHALFSASDAINSGDSQYCLQYDQRGYNRDANCDAGAHEFGGTSPVVEYLPTAPYSGPTSTAPPGNVAPTAFEMPMSAKAGGVVRNIASAADPNGDVLTYHIVTQATQGTAAFEESQFVAGDFYYRADADASGNDWFTFKACDRFVCSAPAKITLLFGEGAVSESMGIQLTSGGTVSTLQVFPEAQFEAVATPDLEFDAPFGAFFFDVSDIPANTEATTVTIQLPNDAVIAENAVVRKLNKLNEWKTLHSGSDPSMSTATIDPIAKTITLILRDNDEFDLNPTVGIINDPVALGVPAKKQASSTSTSTSTSISTTSTGTTQATSGVVEESGGGGGAFNPWWLALSAALLILLRSRRA